MAGSANARWTVLAAPARTDTRRGLEGVPELGLRVPGGQDPNLPPFVGGVILAVSYELGFDLEPAARRGAVRQAEDDRRWPRIIAARCEDALVHDRAAGRWFGIGNWRRITDGLRGEVDQSFRAGVLSSNTGREAFAAQTSRALEHIRAGDVYQVNLAHRLSGTFAGSARGAFAALVAGAAPWYGGYLEFDDDAGFRRAVMSASPELLLSFDPGPRELLTRPMKGTRPGGLAAAELRESAKDRAELNMIVDLMRNDLGRVSAPGSVRVLAARDVERHAQSAPLWQATATVSGKLRDELTLADALQAVFPGGSVTGAPKIRAMRIIDELEPVARGPYCGSVGFVSDSGHAAFNVAIRTALVTGLPAAGTLDGFEEGTLDYSVGAGIVADSVPELEWQETIDKAGVLRAIGRVEG